MSDLLEVLAEPSSISTLHLLRSQLQARTACLNLRSIVNGDNKPTSTNAAVVTRSEIPRRSLFSFPIASPNNRLLSLPIRYSLDTTPYFEVSTMMSPGLRLLLKSKLCFKGLTAARMSTVSTNVVASKSQPTSETAASSKLSPAFPCRWTTSSYETVTRPVTTSEEAAKTIKTSDQAAESFSTQSQVRSSNSNAQPSEVVTIWLHLW